MASDPQPNNVYCFKDRVPEVRAAGVLTHLAGDSVHKCLTHPEHQQVYFEEQEPCPAERTGAGCRTPMNSAYNMCTNVECAMKPNMGHPLLRELWETNYLSWWNKPLGRRRHLPAPPPGAPSPECLTHGISNLPRVVAADVLNPKLTPEQLATNQCAMGLYKVSHGDYDAGEQIKRCYKPPFDPCSRFGLHTRHYEDGRMVRRIMKWINTSPVSMVTHKQADYVEHNRAHLGRQKGPNCYPGRHASEQTLFGLIDSSDSSDCFETSATKKEQLACLKHINNLRFKLKSRVPSFPFDGLYEYLTKVCCCPCISLEALERECRHFQIFINKPIIQIMKNLGIVNENNVNIGRFVDLINWQCKFPELPNAFDPSLPSVYKTIYELSMTGEPDECTELERAGKPTNQYDVVDPLPRSNARKDKECFEYDSDAVALLHPSIFTQYGVDHVDFLRPRCQSEIRKLLCSIGVELPPEVFQKLWEEGCKLDGTGGVCVETFRNLLDKLAYESACF